MRFVVTGAERRQEHAVQHPQTAGGLDDEAESERLEPGHEGQVIAPMTLEACLQALLLDQPQCLRKRVVHRDRRRMMIGPLCAPVFLDHRQIEVPALHLGSPPPKRFERAGSERHGRQARRA